ncbi:hypothetical protein [Propionivibrio sp.]|uniref:hypothetical protein n=1 Tax=Propionivibrio sp. TaxID=2212460 RepID=UPI003BF1083B
MQSRTFAHKRENPLIVHHAPCPDGFGAAYAAWLHFGDEAEYVGADYGSSSELNVQGREVYLLDFSFPRPRLEAMRKTAKSLVVLDHHKTAQEDLEGFPGAIFDMAKSGARLAWEYFQPGKPLPKLLAYVEDRDLWNWNLPESNDFLAYLDTLPFDFKVWDDLAHLGDDELSDILIIGRHMNVKYDNLAAIMAEDAEPVHFCGVRGSKLNAHSLFTSKVGELLYLANGTYALIWRIEKGLLKVSLRARKDTINVAEMARHFGGGGHGAAAAFRLSLGTPECDAFMAKYIVGSGE